MPTSAASEMLQLFGGCNILSASRAHQQFCPIGFFYILQTWLHNAPLHNRPYRTEVQWQTCKNLCKATSPQNNFLVSVAASNGKPISILRPIGFQILIWSHNKGVPNNHHSIGFWKLFSIRRNNLNLNAEVSQGLLKWNDENTLKFEWMLLRVF